jgi:alpha-glucosidase
MQHFYKNGYFSYFSQKDHSMKSSLLILLSFLLALQVVSKELSVTSPSGKLKADITISDKITYSVSLLGNEIISPSEISLKIDELILGVNPNLKSVSTRSVNQQLEPLIRQKSAVIDDIFNEITLHFKGSYSLIFRAYNDGIAWRWSTAIKDQVAVYKEAVNFTFPEDYMLFFPEEQSMFTHQERQYLHLPVSEITSQRFSSMPLLAEAHDNIKIAITEVDLRDYPGMYLTGSADKPFLLQGIFPFYPVKEEMSNDRNVKVTETAGYIAKTGGSRAFPWRVMVITENDGDLIESQMIYKLSSPAADLDFSWVRPGKVAWDWWNANNIYGVDFKSGINTETYKYYIDFASKYGIEYIILDEGWYELGDLMKISPEIDMEELVRYGQEKNVGIILWVVWKTLWDQLDPAMKQFERWGIKGLKVDFMQRDDQWMVNYYWKIAEEAAKRHLLVDFHGSYKPAGLHRTWPNVLTREGVRGMEWGKWSDGASPENAVTIPFIRMLAGPMDYTPGAMINATKEQFRPVFDRPMSQGTRCHQLAMYVVFESPLQMLADSPSHYYEEEECMEFLGPVPTVWDETVVLDAKVGEYILLARRSGDTWYIAAMTNWTPRDVEFNLSFLKGINYTAKIWKDGPNADRYAEDFITSERLVNSGDKLQLHLAPGGGFVGVINP